MFVVHWPTAPCDQEWSIKSFPSLKQDKHKWCIPRFFFAGWGGVGWEIFVCTLGSQPYFNDMAYSPTPQYICISASPRGFFHPGFIWVCVSKEGVFQLAVLSLVRWHRIQPFWLAVGELTNSEQVTLRQSVEHKISKLMLKDCHAAMMSRGISRNFRVKDQSDAVDGRNPAPPGPGMVETL